LPRHAS